MRLGQSSVVTARLDQAALSSCYFGIRQSMGMLWLMAFACILATADRHQQQNTPGFDESHTSTEHLAPRRTLCAAPAMLCGEDQVQASGEWRQGIPDLGGKSSVKHSTKDIFAVCHLNISLPMSGLMHFLQGLVCAPILDFPLLLYLSSQTWEWPTHSNSVQGIRTLRL